jgi:hypothetical protein
VTFVAKTPGAADSTIALTFNGTTDTLTSVVDAWNTANPAKLVRTPPIGQLGTYIPAAGTATLSSSVSIVEIQKVDASGTVTVLAYAPMANSAYTLFDPTAPHVYELSVTGTSPLTFTAYIDHGQQLPAINDENNYLITPANDPITDDGTLLHGDGNPVYSSGYPGFFMGNANTAWVTRFYIWEPGP